MSKFVLTAQLQLQAPGNVKQIVQQIQSQLNGVNVNIQVQNAGQAQKQIQQVAQATNQATTAAERMGKAFALSIRRFAAFSIATRAVGLFTSTLSDAIQTSIDFERQLIKISQVTGKSVSQLRGLTKQITSLSTGFGVASSDLLEVSTILAQAGLSADDTSTALRTLAKAALAPNFDSISETAEGAIAILAQFQEGVGSLEKQLGSINAVAGAFAVEAGDLIDVIRRTGGVFKASGGDLNELLALFTSIRATTRESAESIGTGLRTILTRIQRPKTIEYLKQFGVELTDLNGKFIGPYEAVKQLSAALSGLGEGDITFIKIAEELGGFRQIGKVLPLLQQFSTAQSALNVAMKAGDSLTQDAASAQAALAVRIMKVKEEFLALIRSVTETSTFQIMANTALSLASALIKIGDSIKPLLPMLAALAAFKLAKGLGGFFGGMMSGAASGRAYNKGGKVLGFARGGLVPGSGNRDTVPAMLSPGEFVIRKSSVNKMGASNLAAMNENRYAAGGVVNIGRNNYGSPLNQAERRKLSVLMNPKKGTRLSDEDKKLRDELSARKSVAAQEQSDMKTAYLKDGMIGGLFLQKGAGGTKGITKILQGQEIAGFPDVKQVKGDVYTGLLKSKASSSLRGEIEPAIVKAVENASINTMKMLEIPPLDINEKLASQNAVKRIDIGSIEGHVFEAFISAMSGANLSDPGASFDFINPSEEAKKRLKNIFGPDPVMGKLLDAKRTLSTDTMLSAPNSLANKTISAMKSGLLSPSDFIMKNLGGLIQKFAEGGEVLERGTQKYLISDVVKGMRELQGNQALSQKDAIALFNSKDARGDFIYSNFGGPGSIKLPKWMGTYRPQSAAYGAFQKAQAEKQNRIAGAMSRQGKTMRDYETRREFATGGGVGTDTVPALLTPGEFVVNRSSAQRIGYGNLNRMNKVGKYAKGGFVQRFAAGSSGTGVSSPPSSLDAFNAFFGAVGNNTQAVNTNSTAQKNLSKSAVEVVNNNKMFALSVGASLIQGFLPAIDDNSSAMLRMGNSLLGLVTTIASVGFALETFNVQLSSGSVFKFLTGQGLNLDKVQNNLIGAGVGKGLTNSLISITQVLSKFAGPVVAATGLFYALNTAGKLLVESFNNYEGRIKKLTESGQVEKSQKLAEESQSASNKVTKASGAATGAAVGAAAGAGIAAITMNPFAVMGLSVVGATIGSVIGSFSDALSDTSEYFGQTIAVQASLIQSQKSLTKTSEDATKSLEDFNKGNISSTDLLKSLSSGTANIEKLRQQSENINKQGNKEISREADFAGLRGGLRNVITLGGLLGESTGEKQARIESDQSKASQSVAKQEQELLRVAQPALSAFSRQIAMSGGSFEDLMKKIREVDPNLFNILVRQGTKDLNQSFQNIAKEVEITKAKFAAINLGFRSVTSASDAAALKMDNLMNSFEVGNSPASRAAAVLEASMTSAGQNISKIDFDSSLNEVNNVFKAFGASEEQINKFNGLLQGVAGVQRKFPEIVDTLKQRLQSGELKDINNPTKVGEEFKKIIGQELVKSKIAPAVQKQILDAMGDVKLEQADIDKLLGPEPDYSVLEKYFGDATKEVSQIMKSVLEKNAKIQQQLIEITKKRIDAERNLVEAQKEALDLIMEGREVQAKYGGREVTNQERRQNLLAKSNVEGSRLGLSNMRTGDVPELRRRNLEIMGGFANVEDGRRRNGLEGVRGAEANEFQKDLEKTYKTQIDTIRSLIKLEEDQLKIIEEKNKLEKESLESLAKGDIESFFKQQAAVGARAAIASGDQRSMNLYGSEALGAAASDIQRQKDAGVQSLYGQRLGGAGGLAEAAASAALSSMGVTDMRSAQIMAGTTGEEEASKSRLRELGGLLGETGQIGVQMAEMQVGTATIQAEKAELIVTNLANGGNSPVQNRANGGLIYASRGMFVPRGSDTVPAMLTPGEFVVNRAAVQRGNNLQILSAMNGGSSSSSSTQSESVKMSRGGVVKYFDNGGQVESNQSNPMGSFDNQIMNKFAESLSNFNRNLTLNIDKLKQTSINIKLDSTNVNVNLNDGGLLKALKEEVKKELLTVISNQFKLDNNGNIRRNQTVLG